MPILHVNNGALLFFQHCSPQKWLISSTFKVSWGEYIGQIDRPFDEERWAYSKLVLNVRCAFMNTAHPMPSHEFFFPQYSSPLEYPFLTPSRILIAPTPGILMGYPNLIRHKLSINLLRELVLLVSVFECGGSIVQVLGSFSQLGFGTLLVGHVDIHLRLSNCHLQYGSQYINIAWPSHSHYVHLYIFLIIHNFIKYNYGLIHSSNYINTQTSNHKINNIQYKWIYNYCKTQSFLLKHSHHHRSPLGMLCRWSIWVDNKYIENDCADEFLPVINRGLHQTDHVARAILVLHVINRGLHQTDHVAGQS